MKINFRAERKATRHGEIYELGHKFNRRKSFAKYYQNMVLIREQSVSYVTGEKNLCSHLKVGGSEADHKLGSRNRNIKRRT